MSWRGCYLYTRAWLRNLFATQTISALLGSFGALWLAIQLGRFVFPDLVIRGNTKLPDAIRNAWPFFGSLGVLIAAYRRRPRLAVSHKLSGRDVVIEIAVGDIFSFPGALIIGSNTTFDTRISLDLISPQSVQGIFTRRYYADEAQLDSEVTLRLRDAPAQDLQAKRVGKSTKYALGHCVRVDPKGRTAYLLAIADINEHGVASGTFNGLKDSLAKLWVFIGAHGTKAPLLVPVLGTGFARLAQKREEVIREMIKSFIAACSEMTFTDRLTIVVTPQDAAAHRIDLDELGSFLRHECLYSGFSRSTQEPVGTPDQLTALRYIMEDRRADGYRSIIESTAGQLEKAIPLLVASNTFEEFVRSTGHKLVLSDDPGELSPRDKDPQRRLAMDLLVPAPNVPNDTAKGKVRIYSNRTLVLNPAAKMHFDRAHVILKIEADPELDAVPSPIPPRR